jgi:hypothetical protein
MCVSVVRLFVLSFPSSHDFRFQVGRIHAIDNKQTKPAASLKMRDDPCFFSSDRPTNKAVVTEASVCLKSKGQKQGVELVMNSS